MCTVWSGPPPEQVFPVVNNEALPSRGRGPGIRNVFFTVMNDKNAEVFWVLVYTCCFFPGEIWVVVLHPVFCLLSKAKKKNLLRRVSMLLGLFFQPSRLKRRSVPGTVGSFHVPIRSCSIDRSCVRYVRSGGTRSLFDSFVRSA